MKRFIALTIVALVVMTMLAACNSNSDIDVLNSIEPTEYIPTESPTVLPEITEEPTAHPTATQGPTPEPTVTPEPAGELEQRILAGERYFVCDGSSTLEGDISLSIDFDGDGLREQFTIEREIWMMAGAEYHRNNMYINGAEYGSFGLTERKKVFFVSTDGRTISIVAGYSHDDKDRCYLSQPMNCLAFSEDMIPFNNVRIIEADCLAEEFPLYNRVEDYLEEGFRCKFYDGMELDFNNDGIDEVVDVVYTSDGEYYYVRIGNAELDIHNGYCLAKMKDGTIRIFHPYYPDEYDLGGTTYEYVDGTFVEHKSSPDDFMYLPCNP